MAVLEYRLVKDRHKKPLVVIESALGNGQEISPDALRRLAAEFARIADEADARDVVKRYVQIRKTTQF